ncbi:MAG: 4-(cytidine 5'-diphospho)-2-C-methyl-D-erythritol kinase [Treponema sp.]|jgi:4-diphosphocytidyl-2-C-methyl-D-erythritol kinase|nr:4-(cytidine 5'-diphospho)-2-C-methyl-D-erythritol kinase [Treponema sp.]
MPNLTVQAPAKLNLHLRIGARQPGGLHNLESFFVALAFGDTLNVQTIDQAGALEIHMRGCFPGEDSRNVELAALPAEQNIIYRAVSLFRAKTGCNYGLRITVDKRIPLGGGLGGGSTDAAAVLLAVNTLAAPEDYPQNCPLSRDSLVELGAFLGSDVPFFLYEAVTAWVSGCGERIRPFRTPKPFHELAFLLVIPGFPSETAAAYRLLDESRAKNPVPPPPPPDNSPESLLQALSGPPEQWPFENDFLPLFLADSPPDSSLKNAGTAFRRILTTLRETGAAFAGLSGSGSTCFGVYPSHAAAKTAEIFLLKAGYTTNVTFPLAN